jgi:uncharacterized membrane protein
MTLWGQHISGRLVPVLLTFPIILIVFVLAIFLPPDGTDRAEWLQFIGRFHPLAVHFPIALFLLVPILELAAFSDRYSYLRPTAEFVLGVATLGATFAVILGWCLARSGGYSGQLMQQHMWGGIALAALVWLCWLLRTSGGGSGFVYVVALAGGCILVGWTGYRGGQLSLGEQHLTEHMPAGLRRVLGVSNPAPASIDPHTFYGARIHPILASRCVNCHGTTKSKANLRLDSYEALMRGGKDGPVVRAGNGQGSDLLRRIALPPEHDDFMPKESKRPLSSDEIKVIQLWIASGASATISADAIKDVPTSSASAAPPAEVTFEEVDPATVAKLRATISAAVDQLQKQFPNILEYESRGSADLRLNASILGSKFGDNDLAALAPLAEHITVADFSRTSITDRSSASIAAMKHLRVLRLMNTAISDSTIEGISGLDQLESLSVFGTQVTPAALPTLQKLPKLAHFYAGQTAITSDKAIPAPLAGKIVF